MHQPQHQRGLHTNPLARSRPNVNFMSAGPLAQQLQQHIDAIAAEYGAPSFEPHVTLLGGVRSAEAEVLSLAAELAARLQVLTTCALTPADRISRRLLQSR